ncbi:MAG: hypothetical protein N3A69_06100 [Leptospiraceae bacterium]|nr:hypothetical protein [Leptospiraceae bacterium]
MKKKRWRYYIDKNFQNQFIIKFSSIVFLNMAFTLFLVWLVKEKSYNLLPNNASVLVQVDTQKAIPLSFVGENQVQIDEDNGKLYFPLKTEEGKPAKLYNAFDLYLYPILGVSFLNILVISIFSLFFSHKMAGPLYRIKLTLHNFVTHKTAHKIKLRKNDFFQDLAEKINQALELKKQEEN